MYLPRAQIAQLYSELLRTTHPLSPPVLILTALTVDSLCATRILTALLKRDYIPHKVQPVSGYSDLSRAGQELVLPLTRQRGGDGGVVVCLGVAGLVDIEEILGLDGRDDDGAEDMREHGVEVWVVDARRPWNLQNAFGAVASAQSTGGDASILPARRGVDQGRVLSTYRSGKGGVIVWDDGDIDKELAAEKEAFMALQDMPEISEADVILAGDDGDDDDHDQPSSSPSRKRKADSQDSEDESQQSDTDDEGPPRQRRRSNTDTPILSSPGGNPQSAQVVASTPPTSSQPPSDAVMHSSPPRQPTQRELRRKLLKERRKHEATLDAYYSLGTSQSEPVSSILYSLASELGREDNDLLWLAIVGISSIDLSPLSISSNGGERGSRRILDKPEQIKEVLRDEVRRLNPLSNAELRRSQSIGEGAIPTRAHSATDNSIRLSPEPKFLLIRHWSLYDSMYHSPFLSTRLHIWSESGKKRLHKLLAKMGISLQEAGKGYVHMDLLLKQTLRQRILKFAEMYNLEGLVPGDDGRSGHQGWGFVRSWGWKATLSAVDVAMVASAILEVGSDSPGFEATWDGAGRYSTADPRYNARVRALPTPPHSEDGSQVDPSTATSEPPDWTVHRFFSAYDALNPISSSPKQGLSVLLANIPTAQHLHRAILRTGAALISKKQIRHLRAFRMAVVKEGPDVPLFTHPGALSKLAAWLSDAVQVLEAEKGRTRRSAADDALVLGCLDDSRGVYMVVGLGGGAGGAGSARGARVKSKAEIKAREEKRKVKAAARAAHKAEKARKREERRRLRREIQEANGLIDSEDEESDEAESDVSSSSSGSDSESDESEDEELALARKQRGYGLNRFGQAFQEVVDETGARVRIDSFEHSVVEVKKEDLAGFLERLSLKTVVG